MEVVFFLNPLSKHTFKREEEHMFLFKHVFHQNKMNIVDRKTVLSQKRYQPVLASRTTEGSRRDGTTGLSR